MKKRTQFCTPVIYLTSLSNKFSSIITTKPW
jgi:hypothetical protein